MNAINPNAIVAGRNVTNPIATTANKGKSKGKGKTTASAAPAPASLPPATTATPAAAPVGPKAGPTAANVSPTVETPAAPAPANKPAAKVTKPRATISEFVPPAGKVIKPSSTNSKRGKFIAALESPEGITEAAAQTQFTWTARDVRDVLTQLARNQGYHTKRDESGTWRIVK